VLLIGPIGIVPVGGRDEEDVGRLVMEFDHGDPLNQLSPQTTHQEP
jgi:hypothetical protein